MLYDYLRLTSELALNNKKNILQIQKTHDHTRIIMVLRLDHSQHKYKSFVYLSVINELI